MNEMMTTCINDKLVKFIAKTYNPLDYNKQLTNLLSLAYPKLSFEGIKKFELHQLVNNFVLHKHNGEQVLKYFLFKTFYKKKVTAAFEIKVNNSRADFLTINGSTNSFEIKSSLDNLYKLKKQASDYVLVFDYNYLVIDNRHLDNARELVPKSFGLWSFKNGRKKVHRDAILNEKIDPEMQISILNKKELQLFFPEVRGNQKAIIDNFSKAEINERFKLALKNKYNKRWNFLVENIESILPIDIQFFFKTGIHPSHIYH